MHIPGSCESSCMEISVLPYSVRLKPLNPRHLIKSSLILVFLVAWFQAYMCMAFCCSAEYNALHYRSSDTSSIIERGLKSEACIETWFAALS